MGLIGGNNRLILSHVSEPWDADPSQRGLPLRLVMNLLWLQ
jgi:hypothetical protein